MRGRCWPICLDGRLRLLRRQSIHGREDQFRNSRSPRSSAAERRDDLPPGQRHDSQHESHRASGQSADPVGHDAAAGKQRSRRDGGHSSIASRRDLCHHCARRHFYSRRQRARADLCRRCRTGVSRDCLRFRSVRNRAYPKPAAAASLLKRAPALTWPGTQAAALEGSDIRDAALTRVHRASHPAQP